MCLYLLEIIFTTEKINTNIYTNKLVNNILWNVFIDLLKSTPKIYCAVVLYEVYNLNSFFKTKKLWDILITSK